MIVVDMSALVAIAFAEPEREAFLQAINTAGKAFASTVSVVEPPWSSMVGAVKVR